MSAVDITSIHKYVQYMHFLNNLHCLYGKLYWIFLCEVRYVVLFAQERKMSVYYLWLIVLCLYNRVIWMTEFQNFAIFRYM